MAIEVTRRDQPRSKPQSGAGRRQSAGFLRILLTQLNFQDPLKPVDNAQFIAQWPSSPA